MCIKYGEPVKDSEKIILHQVPLKYYETVRHVGNIFNNDNNGTSNINYKCSSFIGYFKGTDHAGTFMSLKCVVYYANYRSWHQSSKIQVVS